MRNVMLALALLSALTSCAGKTPRSKLSDPHMRVAVWPQGIDSGNFVRIQQALVASGKFVVVDRAVGLAAIKHEQDAQHVTESNRFAYPEKFAHFGKLLGVGAVVVAHTQCANKGSFWTDARYAKCQQFTEIVNSNTGEVMASAEGMEETDLGEGEIAPSWDGTVDRLIAAYPKFYERSHETQELVDYKALSAEEAQRMRERLPAQNPAKQ